MFFGVWFQGFPRDIVGSTNAQATEADAQEGVLFAGTVSKLRIRLSDSAGGAGTFYTFTVRKNGADTAVTCTATGAATGCTDTVNSISFAAGDLFSISAVPSVGTRPTDNLEVLWYVRY